MILFLKVRLEFKYRNNVNDRIIWAAKKEKLNYRVDDSLDKQFFILYRPNLQRIYKMLSK